MWSKHVFSFLSEDETHSGFIYFMKIITWWKKLLPRFQILDFLFGIKFKLTKRECLMKGIYLYLIISLIMFSIFQVTVLNFLSIFLAFLNTEQTYKTNLWDILEKNLSEFSLLKSKALSIKIIALNVNKNLK